MNSPSKTHEFESKLDDGTPVTVGYNILPAEWDVGLMGDYPEIVSVALENDEQAETTPAEDDRLWDEACKNLVGLEPDYD